jgi:FtsZ-binding cell division protein ZapB
VKRKILAIATVTVVAVLVGALFGYIQIKDLQNQIGELQTQNDELQYQNSDLQDQISKLHDQINYLQDRLEEKLNASYESSPVQIVAVNYIGGFNPVVGLLIDSQVNVTVMNNSTYPVSGLTLTTKFLESTGKESGLPYTINIDEIQAGESREIKTWVSWSLGTDHTTLIVTLNLGNLVIDEISGYYH